MKPSTRCALALAVALVLVFLIPPVFAQSVNAPTAFDQFMQRATGAGKQTVQFSKNGTPLPAAGVPTITPDGGQPRVNASGSLRNPSGNPVPVTATGRISGAQVAKALGRAAAKIAPGIAWAIAIKELAVELGFDLAQNPDGTPKVQKQDPTVCTVAPCYSYYVNNYQTQTASSSAAQACAKLIPHINLTAGTQHYWVLNYSTEALCATYLKRYADGSTFNNTNYGITKQSAAPSPAAFTPSNNQEFLDAVAARSGWPTSSAIGRALADPSTQGEEKIQTEPLTITGPATTPGTSSQTQKPNGNTETKTTTHNHTYAGNTVTTTTVTVVNNYNPVTNITETETTTETPPNTEPEPEAPPTDTPLPAFPTLYEPKYPDGLSGVWQEKKAALVATPLVSVVSQLMPSVGAGGSCPAWQLNLDLGSWDFGTQNVAPPCYIWDWCKFFIIAGALLLARALIFGG